METVLSITPENIVTIGFMAVVFILLIVGLQMLIRKAQNASA